MPTVTQIVTQIAPISNFLASNDVANGALFGAPTNPMLPIQLYVETMAIRDRYDYELIADGSIPSMSLVAASNYLYSLCNLRAVYLVQSGGVIPPVTPTNPTYTYPVSSQYIATVDGETELELRDVDGVVLPSTSIVIWVQKSTTPLPLQSVQYNYTAPVLTLLDGISMGAEEILSFLYVVPV